MIEKSTWEEFFDAHAQVYEDNVFTKNTNSSIPDVGCGTGRHSIELAKRGYVVTGLNLSSEILSRAIDAARSAGVNVNWVRSDAAQFSLPGQYDGAICLCEGPFGLPGQMEIMIVASKSAERISTGKAGGKECQ